jgi:SAM-dependent methyltransferase
MLQRIDFDDIDRTITEANAGRSEPEAIAELCRYYASRPPGLQHLEHLDPFSSAYRTGILQALALATGRPQYDPERDEAANYLPDSGPYLPSIYQTGESTWLGEFLQAYGGVLKALDVRRGARILEYGAGEGFMAVQLARLGCDVTVVDIEQRYLKIISSEAKALGASVRGIQGQFGDGPPDLKFDAILFFEAFHHALDHLDLLKQLRARLAANGRVFFAGEPIIEAGSYWEPTLPYPWGPRLDALSLRAMRAYGWCELGFSLGYFIEALMRAGFVVRFRPCADTARGSAYIAQIHQETIALGDAILIEAVGRPNDWHAPEGGHRWSASEEAVLPLDQTPGWRSISVQLANWVPSTKRIELRAGTESTSVTLRPGKTATVRLRLRDAPPRLVVSCELTRLDRFGPSEDLRALGVAVQSVTYHAEE